jgi:site-specific recombinase XerD
MKSIKPKNKSSVFFLETAGRFLNHELPDIRKKSHNTISAYRTSLNAYIDYLETTKGINRAGVCFEDFGKENLKDYLLWMDKTISLGVKTCNLRMTAIRSLLSFASEESIDVTPIYVASKNVKGLKVPAGRIEYFENYQLEAIFNAPDMKRKAERRNRMMLIIGYDTAVRVGELVSLKVGDFHFGAEVPYVSIFGKGSKYRNVPLMNKTVSHLKIYLAEFHTDMDYKKPLFYATTHGNIHSLSDDTVQNALKNYAEQCKGNNVHMPEHVSFHMLRKTRAMDLYRAGCPLSFIQQMLGHENVSTTSGFYAFATLDTLAEALEKANPATGNAEKSWKDGSILKKLYRL